MANTFKNASNVNVGTAPLTIYTVPASTTAVIIGCNLANRTASQIKVDVQAAGVYIIKGVTIPSGAALSVLDGKIILETTKTIRVTSDTASSCDVIVSILEQT